MSQKVCLFSCILQFTQNTHKVQNIIIMKGGNVKDTSSEVLAGPGVLDKNIVDNMKSTEAPEFYEGRLVKHRPARHCIPRYKYYFSSEEWFENNELTKKPRRRGGRRNSVNECETVSSDEKKSDENAREKSSTNLESKNSDNKLLTKKSLETEDSEEYKAHFNVNIPSRVYADTYIRKNAAKWKSTPVPGMLTCSEYDQYRNEAIQPYDRVYEKNRGVLPKYGGYVPGLKFRYGSPFGQLTYNARELGFTKSRTWGGAVSLF